MHYHNNKAICEKIAHERWNPATNEPTPDVEKPIDWHRVEQETNMKILKSYKVRYPGNLNSEIADMLIKRGTSKGERLCSSCHKIYKDNHHSNCNACIAKKKREHLIIGNAYYRANKKGA